jgi:hypothetical protein
MALAAFRRFLRRRYLQCLAATVAVLMAAGSHAASLRVGPPVVDGEAPRVQALLEQGWAAETGRGLRRNPFLAAGLYRQAGVLGSSEGYYRAALVLLPDTRVVPPGGNAACLLAAASQLGHHGAAILLERAGRQDQPINTGCPEDPSLGRIYLEFDLDGYVSSLRLPRQQVVAMIRRLAPLYGVNPQLAVAMAAVESNFNPAALSPRSAMGVMQLIPATAERFGVNKPFDPEQNIRGGLAYLRWLHRYFDGDVERIVAAYNAGEGAVMAHGGVPPYAETLAYVSRVLYFSGFDKQQQARRQVR